MNFSNEMNQFKQICFLQIVGEPVVRIFFTIQLLEDAGYFFILYFIQCIERVAHAVEQTITADVS